MAFSATVISPMKNAERISRSLGVFAGKVTIASYATTLVKCSDITKYFYPTANATTGGFTHGLCSVQIDGPSSGGFIVQWDYTTGAFKCYTPTTLVYSGSATGGAVTWGSALGRVGMACASTPGTFQAVAGEAVANDAIGTFGFVAVGFIR
ncbi:hypothetical protein KKH13_04835 [Patescibacteria group bacterium]|uniref:Uncharacterized protein n=1 Tax=viral metagenome TaxID=1070528 RepID=A0A6M3KWJ7_9ZZZZ|nr:hypothetical protein [Patescibacteria group bacterium]